VVTNAISAHTNNSGSGIHPKNKKNSNQQSQSAQSNHYSPQMLHSGRARSNSQNKDKKEINPNSSGVKAVDFAKTKQTNLNSAADLSSIGTTNFNSITVSASSSSSSSSNLNNPTGFNQPAGNFIFRLHRFQKKEY
jgi:hypothetical protein